MKTNIIYFIFLVHFIIIVVQCSANAGEVNKSPQVTHHESPGLPTNENDLMVPQMEQPPTTSLTESDHDESISYYDISLDQIRQNAIGQYSGTHNDLHIVLVLHANNTYTMTRGEHFYSGPYRITLNAYLPIIDLSLRLNRESIAYYQLITYNGGVTILGLSSHDYGPELVLNRTENSENEIDHHHDEHR